MDKIIYPKTTDSFFRILEKKKIKDWIKSIKIHVNKIMVFFEINYLKFEPLLMFFYTQLM
jgi:hypothetical protein